MRRSDISTASVLVVLSVFAAAPLSGCEDGPGQPYEPSPNGAGDNWNNGNTPPAVDDGGVGFGDPSKEGTTKTETCSAPVKAKRWSAMVKEPVKPPRFAGGLDMAGGDSWAGLTIEDAEKINCQSIAAGDNGGEAFNYWGDAAELVMTYRRSNHKGLRFIVRPGYRGVLTAKSPDGKHTYGFPVNAQMQKDGAPFTLDWTGDNGKNFVGPADDIFRALMFTFAPGLPLDRDGVTCLDTGKCIKGSFGDVAYLFVPAVGVGLFIENQNAPQPTPSIFNRIDIELAKLLPFAQAEPTLKIDAEGPIAQAGKLAKAPAPCTLKMGLTYKEFVTNCVTVTGDAAADLTEKNKLLGGLSHGRERFGFDISGVDVNFSAKSLKDDAILGDKDLPIDSDISTTFVVDQSTQGALRNDLDSTGAVDLHGAGAIYKEFARATRAQLLSDAKIADGDITKCYAPNPIPSGFDPDAFIAALPAWCTGMEQLLTAAPPIAAGDPVNLGINVTKITKDYARGMKPGHMKVTFCIDPTGDVTKGYKYCNAPWGSTGDVFRTSYDWVLRVFGKGKVTKLPFDAQDIRFYWKQYTTAIFKYMTVGDKNPVPDLSAIVLDQDNLFFDAVGSQFEIAEYIDRRFASKTQDPTDITMVADTKGGIFNDYAFSRELYRGEEALYAAVLEDQADGLGQENSGLLTNIFGSPVLKKGWKDAKSGKTAYECATADPPNPTACDGQKPPVDAFGSTLKDLKGRPILKPYKGAFTGTSFSLGKTNVNILATYPKIESAKISVPLFKDPYDNKSTSLPPIVKLVPWAPKQPGIGFPVAINGSLDKFVQTAQLELSGTTITANIDYDIGIGADGSPDGTQKFLAVETTDFLGRAFLCRDSGTGDLLDVRMYSPVSLVLDWLKAHPSAYSDCGIIIRYSPFGNYVDFITSLTNGVRLGVTQGGGFGRVVDVTLFVPGS